MRSVITVTWTRAYPAVCQFHGQVNACKLQLTRVLQSFNDERRLCLKNYGHFRQHYHHHQRHRQQRQHQQRPQRCDATRYRFRLLRADAAAEWQADVPVHVHDYTYCLSRFARHTEWSRKKMHKSLMQRHFATVCSRITQFSPKCLEINW